MKRTVPKKTMWFLATGNTILKITGGIRKGKTKRTGIFLR